MTDERQLKRVETDGVKAEFLTPQEQAAQDARTVEKSKLKKNRSLSKFLRVFGVTTEDRPT